LYLLPPSASKGYRSYPLREPKPLRGFGFTEFALRANSWASLGEFGAKPQTPKTKTLCVLVPLALLKNGLRAVFEL
jgi:hypothetical protein